MAVEIWVVWVPQPVMSSTVEKLSSHSLQGCVMGSSTTLVTTA